MKHSTVKKSSFSLPSAEVKKVQRLKKRLGFKSNTAVIRKALVDLEAKMDRDFLRKEFEKAVKLVTADGYPEMKELDQLSDEGLD